MNMRDRIERAYKGRPTGPESSASKAGEETREEAEEKGGKKGQTPQRPPAPAKAPVPARSSTPAIPKAFQRRGAALGLTEAERKAEGLLKSGADSGMAKAARFLLLLGTDEAAKVLSHLSPAEIEAVSREILSVKKLDSIEANEILAEFGWLVKTKGFAIEGGPEIAERMLTAAFGPERARDLLRKAAPDFQRPFHFLGTFEARELQVIFKDESPQVLAVVLPWLEPKKASGLIQLIPEDARIEVVKRIARLEKVSPEVLRRIEETLKDRIIRLGTVSTEEIDGKTALANILRHVDPRLEERVLGILDEESPEVSRSVRERLFTLEDVVRVPSRDLQKALRDFQDRDLALILKGRNDDFREKILANVSKNRAALILDEYKLLGAVRREDADEAAREFLTYLKRAWDAGELLLEGEDELVT